VVNETSFDCVKDFLIVNAHVENGNGSRLLGAQIWTWNVHEVIANGTDHHENENGVVENESANDDVNGNAIDGV